MNEILRAKITSYAAPVSSSPDDIVRHNSQLQELQDLWNANKIHPHVLNAELTRIHQLVMTLKKVNSARVGGKADASLPPLAITGTSR